MKDHGQQARASGNFAGPVDFETPRPDLPVHFLNFQKPWLTGKSGLGVSKSTGPAKFSMALACWPWSFISPADDATDKSWLAHDDKTGFTIRSDDVIQPAPVNTIIPNTLKQIYN